MHAQEVSPLARIAQLCCSIDQPLQSQTTKNIRGEINFRYGNHAQSSSPRQLHLQRGRRRTTLRSIDAAKRNLPSSLSTLDFYFRSFSAARPLAAGFDFRHTGAPVSWPRVFPTLSSIARPRALRLVPRFRALLPTGIGIFGRAEIDQKVSNQSDAAFGRFPPPLYLNDARNAVPLNWTWSSSSMEYIPLSRDHVVKEPVIVTSPEGRGTNHDAQQPSAPHWNSPSSLCLRSLPWQPSY